MSLSKYHNLFTKYLEGYHQKENPKGLYEPISYILSLGGKRLRPLLTLMATEAFGKDANEALAAALSVEIFHNFTLMQHHFEEGNQLSIISGIPTQEYSLEMQCWFRDINALKFMKIPCMES